MTVLHTQPMAVVNTISDIVIVGEALRKALTEAGPSESMDMWAVVNVFSGHVLRPMRHKGATVLPRSALTHTPSTASGHLTTKAATQADSPIASRRLAFLLGCQVSDVRWRVLCAQDTTDGINNKAVDENN